MASAECFIERFKFLLDPGIFDEARRLRGDAKGANRVR